MDWSKLLPVFIPLIGICVICVARIVVTKLVIRNAEKLSDA